MSRKIDKLQILLLKDLYSDESVSDIETTLRKMNSTDYVIETKKVSSISDIHFPILYSHVLISSYYGDGNFNENKGEQLLREIGNAYTIPIIMYCPFTSKNDENKLKKWKKKKYIFDYFLYDHRGKFENQLKKILKNVKNRWETKQSLGFKNYEELIARFE